MMCCLLHRGYSVQSISSHDFRTDEDLMHCLESYLGFTLLPKYSALIRRPRPLQAIFSHLATGYSIRTIPWSWKSGTAIRIPAELLRSDSPISPTVGVIFHT